MGADTPKESPVSSVSTVIAPLGLVGTAMSGSLLDEDILAPSPLSVPPRPVGTGMEGSLWEDLLQVCHPVIT